MSLKLYQPDGKNYYVRGTIGNSGELNFSTKTNNKKAAEGIRIRTEAKWLNESVHGEVKNCTFMEAALAYLNNEGEAIYLGEWNAATNKGTLLLGEFGERTLRSITQSELDAAGRKLYPNCQPDTVNRQCHAPFIAVYNLAKSDGFADPRDWTRPKWKNGRYNGLVKAEMKRRVGSFAVEFEHAAPFVLAMSPAPAMVLTTIFYSGMRPSEVFKLEAPAVNIKGRWINLDWNTKTEEPRGVPLAEVLVPMFTALVKRGGILFRTPRGQPYPVAEDDKVSGQMKSAINGARQRSKIMDIAPYTGRHSCSTGLIVAGVNPYVKDQIMGHVVDDMSHNYTHVPQRAQIEAINKLPVIKAWANAPWMLDPLAHASKLAGEQGSRNDLAANKVRNAKRAAVKAKAAAATALRTKRLARKAAA